jgi:NADH-quinone oxidoreductase subunit N
MLSFFFSNRFFFPEAILLLTLFLIVCLNFFWVHHSGISALFGLVGLFFAVGYEVFSFSSLESFLVQQVFCVDRFACFFKIIFMTAGILQFFLSVFSQQMRAEKIADFHILVLSLVLGLMFLVSSCDLVFSFLALFLICVSSLFLIAFDEKSLFSIESAIKSYVYWLIALAFFLYVVGIFFFLTNHLNIYAIQAVVKKSFLDPKLLIVLFTLLMVTLGPSLQLYPFHFLSPDLLQGAASGVSFFVSFGVRSAMVGFSIRMLIVLFSEKWAALPLWDWTSLGLILSSFSMGFGSIVGFTQNSFKRMMGYFLITQSGFYFMGISVLSSIGIQSVLFNLVVEMFSLCGIFSVLVLLFKSDRGDDFQDFSGLLHRSPLGSISLLAFVFSLIGVPPFPGFMGKFLLIGVAISAQHYVLAAIAIMSLLLSTAGVFRFAYQVIRTDLFVDDQVFSSQQIGRLEKLYLFLFWFVLIWIVLYSNKLLFWTTQAIDFLDHAV